MKVHSAKIPASQPGTVDTLEAMAVKGFAATQTTLQWIKAQSHFFISRGDMVAAGDYAEVQSDVAERLIANGQAVEASKEEVEAAVLGARTKVAKS